MCVIFVILRMAGKVCFLPYYWTDARCYGLKVSRKLLYLCFFYN